MVHKLVNKYMKH